MFGYGHISDFHINFALFNTVCGLSILTQYVCALGWVISRGPISSMCKTILDKVYFISL